MSDKWWERAYNAWGFAGIGTLLGVMLFWPHAPRVIQILALVFSMSWYGVERWRTR